MIRYAAAVAVALCLCPSWLCAQSVQLTVNVASANVHKSPSVASPVIGKAPRGAALEVTRELGDWVKVPWPSDPDGIGYVRVSAGSIAGRSTSSSTRMAQSTPAQPATASASPATAAAQTELPRQPTRVTAALVAPPTHFIGLGGGMVSQLRSSTGFGVGARAWSRGPLGIQLDGSRYSSSDPLMGRLTSLQLAPSVLYAFPDRVSDYLWIRPYVGAGVNMYRATLNNVTLGLSSFNNGFGFQAFGGGEMTFASAPRFALSADLGYHSSNTPFIGVELGGAVVSVSGHYYIK